MADKPWVKWFPGDFLNGIADLEPNELAAYVVVLNLIYDNGGPVQYDPTRLARRLRMRVGTLVKAIESLIEAGKLALCEGRLTNRKAEMLLEKRAGKSVKATEAAQTRWRNETEKISENKGWTDADAMQTVCERNANQKLESRTPLTPQGVQLSLVPIDVPVDEVRQAYDLWNEMARKHGLAVATALNDTRRKAIARRLGEGGIDGWKRAISAVSRSSLCLGQVSRLDGSTWRASLDWVCKAASFQKLVEGVYGQDAKVTEATSTASPESPWPTRMIGWNVSGYWDLDWGPKPGQLGCRAPDQTTKIAS